MTLAPQAYQPGQSIYGGLYNPPAAPTAQNPAARTGNGAYGLVPGSLQLPNPQGDLANVYPNLNAATGKASDNILSELTGQLSPETLNNITNGAATYGVRNGMPGGNASPGALPFNLGLQSLGMTTEQLQHQGLTDFNNTSAGVAGTQTVNPNLQTQIGEYNATMNSAPDPASAAAQQLATYLQLAKQFSGGGGGRITGLPNTGFGGGGGFSMPGFGSGARRGPAFSPFSSLYSPGNLSNPNGGFDEQTFEQMLGLSPNVTGQADPFAMDLLSGIGYDPSSVGSDGFSYGGGAGTGYAGAPDVGYNSGNVGGDGFSFADIGGDW